MPAAKNAKKKTPTARKTKPAAARQRKAPARPRKTAARAPQPAAPAPVVERAGLIEVGGKPATVIGADVTAGQRAPDFTAQVGIWPGREMWQELSPLAETAGQVRILAAVPSLDTATCTLETRRFNQEAAALADDIVIITVSTDLPPAQKRWCGAEGVERVRVVSDHMAAEFGQRYGTLIKERRWLRRAVFVVDRLDRVVYADYMPKLGQEPDYAAVLEAARRALGGGPSAEEGRQP